ncbi:calcium-dependent secretion activator [Acrasis kona]|uniref:Calcium-dependent secretion activator n=1 Tax=Acrasis kona TaxID=1008807 RepID=A0AAW2ZDJ1_9EUKA
MTEHKRSTSITKRLGLTQIKFSPFVKSSANLKKGTETKKKEKETEIRNRVRRQSVSLETSDEIRSLPLDQFLNEDDAPEDRTRRIPSQERTAYKHAIKNVYLPLRSQIDHSSFTNTVLLNPLNDNDHSVASVLVDTLGEAFPWSCQPNQPGNFQSTWDELHETCFGRKPVDITIEDLEKRLYTVDSDRDLFYKSSNFKNRQEYEDWKTDQIQSIKQLINTVKQLRKDSFMCQINIVVSEVTFDQVQQLLNKNISEMYYKIVSDKEIPKEKALYSKPVKISHSEDSTESDFTCTKLTFNLNEPQQELRIRFYFKYMLRSTFIGQIEIEIQDLISKIRPPNATWGARHLNLLYSIKNVDRVEVGTAKIHLSLQFEHFPPVSPCDEIVPKKSEPIHYHALFDILMSRMVSSIKPANIIDKSKTGELGQSPFNFYHMWIMQEFVTSYGISEITKRLTILKCLSERIDLLVPYLDYFYQNIEFIHANDEMHFAHVTKSDSEQLDRIMSTLGDKVESLLRKFKSIFAQNKPNGALRALVRVYEFVLMEQNGISAQHFEDRIEKIVQKAILDDYKSMKPTVLNQVDQLTNICVNVEKAISDIRCFQNVFEMMADFRLTALEIYYNSFAKDVDKVLKEHKEPTGHDMLNLCSQIIELNAQVQELYDDEDLEDVKILNADKISTGFAEKYIQELHVQLQKWMIQAVAQDDFNPMYGVLHSSSVVDLFTAANQMLEFMSNSIFVGAETLSQFAQVLSDVTVDYSRYLKNKCISESECQQESSPSQIMASPSTHHKKGILSTLDFNKLVPTLKSNAADEDDSCPKIAPMRITRQFIVKVNNVAAAKTQLEALIENLEDTKHYYVPDEDTEEETDIIEHDSDDSELESTSCSDLTSTNSSATTPTTNHHSFIKKKPNATSPQDDQDDTNTEITPLQSAFSNLNSTLDELIILISTQFQQYIHIAMRMAIGDMRDFHYKGLSEQQILSQLGPRVESLLYNRLMTPFMSPHLELLSQSLYQDAFNQVLQKIYKLFMTEMAGLMLPNVYINGEQSNQIRKGLKPHQVYLMKYTLDLIDSYMAGSSDNGLSRSVMEKEAKLLNTLLKLYNRPTQDIIKLYQKYGEYPTLNTTSVTKDYHLVALLAVRARKDKQAAHFCEQHMAEAEERRLAQRYRLQPDVDGKPLLLASENCSNRGMLVGMCHLTRTHLLYEAGNNPLVFSRVGRAAPHLRNSTSMVSAATARIDLEDLVRMARNNNLLGKGLHVYFDNHKGNKGDLKVFFGKSKTRDLFYEQIIKAVRELNICQIAEQPKFVLFVKNNQPGDQPFIGSSLSNISTLSSSPSSSSVPSVARSNVSQVPEFPTLDLDELSDDPEHDLSGSRRMKTSDASTDDDDTTQNTSALDDEDTSLGEDDTDTDEVTNGSFDLKLKSLISPGSTSATPTKSVTLKVPKHNKTSSMTETSLKKLREKGDMQSYFNHVFKALVGETVKVYVPAVKMEKIKEGRKKIVKETEGALFVTDRYVCFSDVADDSVCSVVGLQTITSVKTKKWKLVHKRLVLQTKSGERFKFSIDGNKQLKLVYEAIKGNKL